MRLFVILLSLCLWLCCGCGDPIACPSIPIVENGAFPAMELDLVGLTTQIVVDRQRETYPRQCYFGESHIDFGNYYNHRYHFTHEEFLASTDTIFDGLDRSERERLLALTKGMLAAGIVCAEYSYGFQRYVYLVRPSGEYEEQVFMLNAEGLDLSTPEHDQALVVLGTRNGYAFFRHRS